MTVIVPKLLWVKGETHQVVATVLVGHEVWGSVSRQRWCVELTPDIVNVTLVFVNSNVAELSSMIRFLRRVELAVIVFIYGQCKQTETVCETNA